MVKAERQVHPRIGTRKLYHILYEQLQKLKVGRDRFFDILRANHLLIIPKKSYHITTWSHHRFRKHPNLVSNLQITSPDQVWAADITYIGKREKPCYLSLITDAYSKKIVGYNVSDSLSSLGSIKALKMAYKNRSAKMGRPIHHSDRGIQYCCEEYQYLLEKYGLRYSMTQNSDPYENAVAERINGILKQEFTIDTYHLELPLMEKIVSEAIQIYNEYRPHWSNYMLTPQQMHMQNQVQMRTYKQKNSSRHKPTTV
jgi:putative transposase